MDVPDEHAGGGHAHALLAGLFDLVARHVPCDDGDDRHREAAGEGDDVSHERADTGNKADHGESVGLARAHGLHRA